MYSASVIPPWPVIGTAYGEKMVVPEPPSPSPFVCVANAGAAVLAQAMNATTVTMVAARTWWVGLAFIGMLLVLVADGSTFVLRPPGGDRERPLRFRVGALRSGWPGSRGVGEVGESRAARRHTRCHEIGCLGSNAVRLRRRTSLVARRGPYRPGRGTVGLT